MNSRRLLRIAMLSASPAPLLLLFGAAPAEETAENGDGKAIIVKGDFEWNSIKGKRHGLLGKLTPTGENKWDVVWNFKWRDQPVTYKGVITGDVQNGEVNGTGNQLDNRRKFAFKGMAKDGVWTMRCAEITKGDNVTDQGNARVTVQQAPAAHNPGIIRAQGK